MPGYGIQSAAVTLIGQCYGARRHELTRRLGWITTISGIVVMTCAGILMYIFAPEMIGILSPDPVIRKLGTQVLRIEAFAEPMFGASIVASGVFRGTGDTLSATIRNIISMWGVRIPLAAVLSGRLGLRGVWIAMCTELIVRGILFLTHLAGHKWEKIRN
jgi:Na+-driven multidrug efflux pump